MEFTQREILAHLRGVKQANETMLKINFGPKLNTKLEIEIDLLNDLFLRFDDKQKKPGEN